MALQFGRAGWPAVVAAIFSSAPLGAQPVDFGRTEDGATTSRLVAAGLGGLAGGWLVGFAGGAGLAAWNPLDGDEIDDGAWTPGLLIGLQTGQAVGIPVAVHLANGRKGNLTASLGASAAVGLAAIALMWTDDLDGLFESPGNTAAWVTLPLVQIGISVWIERATAR